jgi:nitrogenase molybdenum-cofactor synthesis protein NifE
VIGTQEPAYTTPYDINLIGEYNIAGEMWAVLPLLEKLGIRVLAKITGMLATTRWPAPIGPSST